MLVENVASYFQIISVLGVSKLSIGAYIGGRSDKMGNFEGSTEERPSFGLNFRTPSPKKKFNLAKEAAIQLGKKRVKVI